VTSVFLGRSALVALKHDDISRSCTLPIVKVAKLLALPPALPLALLPSIGVLL